MCVHMCASAHSEMFISSTLIPLQGQPYSSHS